MFSRLVAPLIPENRLGARNLAAAFPEKSAAERRRIHVGFSAGRFDFMNRAYGVLPRTATEKAMPPFAVPSSLAMRMSEMSTASANSLACTSPF